MSFTGNLELRCCMNLSSDSALSGNNCATVHRAWTTYTASPTAYDLGSVRSITTQEILIVGGVVKSRILNRWFADASGLPIRLGMCDATAYGNAAIQAVTKGWVNSFSELSSILQNYEEEQIIEPQNEKKWKKPLSQLKELIQNEKIR